MLVVQKEGLTYLWFLFPNSVFSLSHACFITLLPPPPPPLSCLHCKIPVFRSGITLISLAGKESRTGGNVSLSVVQYRGERGRNITEMQFEVVGFQ